jgi:hypothetical protein
MYHNFLCDNKDLIKAVLSENAGSESAIPNTEGRQGFTNRLNMELRVNLQNLFGLHVHSSVLIGWDLATPPAFGLIYEDAIGPPR